jgi:hypothetical protein
MYDAAACRDRRISSNLLYRATRLRPRLSVREKPEVGALRNRDRSGASLGQKQHCRAVLF